MAALLQAAGQAHHTYQEEELDGVRNEDWPRWYAAWLLENGLQTMFAPPPQQEKLAGQLARISADHKAAESDESWPDYTAPRLLDALSAGGR